MRFSGTPRPDFDYMQEEKRATGLKRVWEVLSRDYIRLYAAGMLNVLTMVPLGFLLGYAQATHSILISMLGGILGGIIAAPCFYGMCDSLMRSLRDDYTGWREQYRTSIRENWKSTLFPGAFWGMIFSLQFFILMHLHVLDGGVLILVSRVVSIAVFTGLFLWFISQHVLIQIGFAALFKNSFLLFFRFFPKTVEITAAALVYLGLLLRMFPNSVFLLISAGFWLPLLCIFLIIYPSLDQIFSIETTLQKRKKSSAQSED
ncbi:MAG: hypothetical protein IJ130_05830 [Solobacterium sp.]|nr:hypothetical protein [Solobacterium sp.]